MFFSGGLLWSEKPDTGCREGGWSVSARWCWGDRRDGNAQRAQHRLPARGSRECADAVTRDRPCPTPALSPSAALRRHSCPSSLKFLSLWTF
jgi:hypothetical protein